MGETPKDMLAADALATAIGLSRENIKLKRALLITNALNIVLALLLLVVLL